MILIDEEQRGIMQVMQKPSKRAGWPPKNSVIGAVLEGEIKGPESRGHMSKFTIFPREGNKSVKWKSHPLTADGRYPRCCIWW